MGSQGGTEKRVGRGEVEEGGDETKNSFFIGAHCNRKPRWSTMQDIFYSPYFGLLRAFDFLLLYRFNIFAHE